MHSKEVFESEWKVLVVDEYTGADAEDPAKEKFKKRCINCEWRKYCNKYFLSRKAFFST